jgi:hypothetical protein
MTFHVVDRIEGTVAVVVGDDGRSIDVPRRDLPKGAREGSVLRIEAKGATIDWSQAVIDDAERDRRLRVARENLDRLSESDRGGDIQL